MGKRPQKILPFLLAFLIFVHGNPIFAAQSEAQRSTDLLAAWLRKSGATDIQGEMNKSRLASSAYKALAAHFSTQPKPAFTGEQYCRLLYEEQEKVAALYIATLKERGVNVKRYPTYYSERLDEFYSDNFDMKKEACTLILKTLVIMEYDWYEQDVDRDLLAHQWLGDELYLENKKRVYAEE